VIFSAFAALALLALPTPRADAQASGQGQVEGQIVNGTKDAKTPNTAGLTVTLYVANMSTQSTITKTTQSDASGRFAFSNLDVVSTTRMLALANYGGIDYASDILAFDGITTTAPASITVYETTTDPSVLQVAQTHLVFGIETGLLNVLEVVQVTNTSDRSYIGDTAIGPHRITLPLPVLAGAADIQFQTQDADATTIRGTNVLSYTLPFQPGNDQVVFNYTVPFTPPAYQFSLQLPFDTAKFGVLLADVGGTITSTQLSAPTNFPTQGGQNFLLSSADNLTKGTEVKATFNSLPATVNAPAGTTPGTSPAAAPATPVTDNSSQMLGFGVLGLAAVAAILLIAYPLLRRRANQVAVASTNRRMDLLQSIADLDDDFEAGKVTESTYKEERARLKAKLAELGDDE